jgi:glycosyltransferase involved in cell wall biosynthesis
MIDAPEFAAPVTASAVTTDPLEVTILMPCLNEARTVASCVATARSFLERAGIHGEVLVADNGSQDGSRELAMAAGARVLEVPQRGYGAALISGIRAARGRFVIMGDADASYDFARLESFVERLRAGADLVMGNRFRGGIADGAMPFLHRYLGNPVLSFIGRRFFRVTIGDFHCGLRGFERERVLALSLVSPGMEFASEMVAKAALARLRIEEVPTTLRPDGRDRAPHLRTWRDGWRHLRFLLLFCPRWLFLYPGAVLLLAGVLGLMLISRGTVRIASLGLDIHSLLYMAAATVLGAQMLALALLTKWLATLAGIVEEPRWVALARRYASVEVALIASLAVVACGLFASAQLVLQWGGAGFGVLEPSQMMRQAIPAVTLIIVGAQAGTASLFAAALDASWRSRGVSSA